jgi:tetratricopeptide (TPR) repeat protein
LTASPKTPTTARARALYAACMIASTQGDVAAATALVTEGRALVQENADPIARAGVAIGDGFTALAAGHLDHACACLHDAIDERTSPTMRGGALIILGWARELRGESGPAVACYEKALALSERHGESMYRMLALLSIGAARWRHGDIDQAIPMLRRCLELAELVNDRRTAAYCLETLAWVAGEANSPRTAAVMLGAAAGLSHGVGSTSVPFAHLLTHHDECEGLARSALGTEQFGVAYEEGSSLNFNDAIRLGLEVELKEEGRRDP